MQDVALSPDEQQFHSYSADLFTVKGILAFTRQLHNESARFDHLVFTVGMWPNPGHPQIQLRRSLGWAPNAC